MNLNLGCISDRGNYRSKNQDRIMCNSSRVGQDVLAVACVCDGIGSFRNSEIASEMVVRGIAHWFEGTLKYYPKVMDKRTLVEDLEITIRELNELVYEHGESNSEKIGCTMSLIFLVNTEYFIFHVGDSRIFCLRDKLLQLTKDEVLLKQVNGKEKTLLMNHMGKDRLLYLNRQYGYAEPNDAYILGTDGLFKKLKYEDLNDLSRNLCGDYEVERVCRKLIDKVLERGEKDNVSCAILQIT